MNRPPSVPSAVVLRRGAAAVGRGRVVVPLLGSLVGSLLGALLAGLFGGRVAATEPPPPPAAGPGGAAPAAAPEAPALAPAVARPTVAGAPADRGGPGLAVPGGRRLSDLVYATVGARPLTLDLYLPTTPGPRACPLVVWVHGGGWVAGDKRPCPTVGMLAHGIATASIGYRLAPEARYPAQVMDVKAAVQWLRAHAATFGLDPDRVGAAGASAGGHLVALLGLATDAPDLEPVAPPGTPGARVAAVCDLCGPTDLERFGGHGSVLPTTGEASLFERLLGGPIATKRDLARRANPLTFVRRDAPPFLIVHGDRDDVVPLHQSRLLHDALVAAGATSELLVVPGAGHDLARADVAVKVLAFFRERLAAPPAPAPTAPVVPK